MASDTFFNPDPPGTAVSDVFQNTLGGDVWFDVTSVRTQDTSWDILNAFLQNTSWDILNENSRDVAWDILNANARNIAWDILNSMDQDVSWSIFAKILYYIQRFVVNAICFDYGIKEPLNFDSSIANPLEFTYRPTEVIDTTINLALGEFSFDTINVNDPVTFDFSIKEPITFTFGVSTVLSGSRATENRG